MKASERHEKKKAVMEKIHVVEAILRAWDPIGVAPGKFAPADEYDSYAPRIVSLLAGGCALEALADHLEQIRTMSIGLPPDRDSDKQYAERLMTWWQEKNEQA